MGLLPRTLIVDDTQITREYLRKNLVTLGVNPDIAQDGLQGRLALARKEYDLVFMDINMPIMTGFEVVRELKQHALSLPYVVGVTATLRPHEWEHFKEAGFDEFFQHPLPKDALKKIVEKF